MILVVGATGILGGIIIRQLLTAGQPVRILARHNSPSEQLAAQDLATPMQSLLDAGTVPVYGDLKDRASLDAACQGVDTLISTANSVMRGGEDTVDSVDRAGNRGLIDAAKASGVKQFIFVSFLGASHQSPVPFFQAKAETEDYLAASGLTYTILAPNFFMEPWIGMVVGIPLKAHQPITLVGQGRRLHSLISVGDVAAFAVAVIGHPSALNQRLALGGPQPLSWTGIVETFGQLLGQPLPVQYVAPGQPMPLLPEMVPPMLIAMETYDSAIPMQAVAQTFAVRQTSLEVMARRMLGLPQA